MSMSMRANEAWRMSVVIDGRAIKGEVGRGRDGYQIAGRVPAGLPPGGGVGVHLHDGVASLVTWAADTPWSQADLLGEMIPIGDVGPGGEVRWRIHGATRAGSVTGVSDALDLSAVLSEQGHRRLADVTAEQPLDLRSAITAATTRDEAIDALLTALGRTDLTLAAAQKE
jgi:hypothetical protein